MAMQATMHVLSLAHVPVRAESTRCAYTMKVYNLCRMLKRLGHRVILYALEGSDESICDKMVACVSKKRWEKVYGKDDTAMFQFDWNTSDQCWREYQKNAAFELARNFSSCDSTRPEFVLCSFGWAHEPCTKKLPDNAIIVESGIGYRSSWANFRVFESRALYHLSLGQANPGKVVTGQFYWTVIPNYFDADHFSFSAKKAGYFLYMGRINHDKGYQIALDTGRAVGVPVLCVGQLPIEQTKDGKKINDANAIMKDITGRGGKYIPSVGPEERRVLLAGANALFVPSYYIEPFGGVHIEAGLSGTPVITTDWGVFGETVHQGVTGFRCKSMAEFVWAAKNLHTIKPEACREWAVRNFSLDAVAPRYQAYFTKLHRLMLGKGWDCVDPDLLDGGEIPASMPDNTALGYSAPQLSLPVACDGPAWVNAQKHEAEYWDHHAAAEPPKQTEYLDMMGLDIAQLEGKDCLDIGGGPASLLKSLNGSCGRRAVVDPMDCGKGYEGSGIEFVRGLAEKLNGQVGIFDHVLIYNVLQHVVDPSEVLHRAWEHVAEGGTLWFCEAVDRPLSECHLHTVRVGQLSQAVAELVGCARSSLRIIEGTSPIVTGRWLAGSCIKAEPASAHASAQ